MTRTSFRFFTYTVGLLELVFLSIVFWAFWIC